MTISDYAVIGTADGVFAHGTGLLSEVHAAVDLFQYRLPPDSTAIIPRAGAVTILRHPTVALTTRERFHLFVQLAVAFDRAKRPGFVGTAVLIPWDEISVSSAGAVLERLDILFQQAKDSYLDESGMFIKQPGPLKTAQRENAPRLKAADDGSRRIYQLADGEFSEPLVARGLHVLSTLEANTRTLIQITTDSGSEFTPLTIDVVSQFEEELAEEERLREAVQEQQRRQDEMASLTARIGRLEASIRQLASDVHLLRTDTVQSYASKESASYPASTQCSNAALPERSIQYQESDFEIGDPELRQNRSMMIKSFREIGLGRTILIGGALLGSILLVVVPVMFLIGGGNGESDTLIIEGDVEASETSVSVATSCKAAREVFVDSGLSGESIIEKIQELRSCVRVEFDGVSPLQRSCDDPVFENTASKLGDGIFFDKDILSALDEVAERCEGEFQ